MPVAPNPVMLTMPDVATRTGASLDKIRKLKRKLEAAGLIVKVGGVWLCVEANARAIADKVGAKKSE